jgi:hypothetical protein
VQSFTQFLESVAREGGAVNLAFEERLFGLVAVLQKITEPLMAEDVPYELVGGLAVLVHVEAVDPEQSMLTRDVDLMVRRADLERVKEIAARHGFRYRHSAGLDMLMFGDTDRARNSVHLLFADESVRPGQAPNPTIHPELKSVLGQNVFVIPVAGLVRMKLNAYRLKDQVHIQVLDAAGLISPEIENALSPELQSRLHHIRETE